MSMFRFQATETHVDPSYNDFEFNRTYFNDMLDGMSTVRQHARFKDRYTAYLADLSTFYYSTSVDGSLSALGAYLKQDPQLRQMEKIVRALAHLRCYVAAYDLLRSLQMTVLVKVGQFEAQ